MNRVSNANSLRLRRKCQASEHKQGLDRWAEQRTEVTEQTKLNQKSQTSNFQLTK